MRPGESSHRDQNLNQEETEQVMEHGLVGRVGTVGADGTPYVTPLNYVYETAKRRIYLHLSSRPGHLLTNLSHSPRACFEVDEPGELVATGEYGCNTSQIYRSAICFGTMALVEDGREKERISRLFVQKYVDRLMPGRTYNPELARIDEIAILTLDVESLTGKAYEPPPGSQGDARGTRRRRTR